MDCREYAVAALNEEDAHGLLEETQSDDSYLAAPLCCCSHPFAITGLIALILGVPLTLLALRTPDRDPDRGPSLFCFALMLSDTYEVLLLKKQFEKRVGLFDCDAYSVFSDAPVLLGGWPPVRAEVIPGQLRVPHDPVYNFALNTRVFLRVWARVLAHAEFRRHDWTVKLDPDTVFLPDRLRQHLRRGPSPRARVSLLNCRLGLRGPIELLSARAVEALGAGLQRCRAERAGGLDTEGEDTYLDACLKLLGVSQVEDFGLLSDARCREQPFPCTAGRVAFHPFKRVDRYFQCLAQAQG
mmetsp:Transcript_66222/g.132893  ORF Transcript_66222/g.132893 Transcript_66222/m.132893 type:complete len:298 (+) Transcript_66222:110-1003(+)